MAKVALDVCLFIFGPLLIYYLWLFFSQRYKMEIFTLCILFIDFPLNFLLLLPTNNNNNNSNSYGWILLTTSIQSIVQLILLFLSLIFYFCLILSIFERLWLLFYDVKVQLSMQNQEWKRYLHPKKCNQNQYQNSFFIRYQKTLGNTKFVIKLMCLCAIFMILIAYLIILIMHEFNINLKSNKLNDEIHSLIFWIAATLLSIVTIVFCILWYKLPYFDDLFYIRSEMNHFLKKIGIGLSLLFFLVIIKFSIYKSIFDSNNNNNSQSISVFI